MEVILLKEVNNIGQPGDVKNVSPGFARNFLFPQKLASLVTPDIKQQFKKEKAQKNKEIKQEESQLRELASSLENLKISFKEKASQEGTLFSGLTREKIAQKIKKTAGKIITEDNIIMAKPIKQIGGHTVVINVNNKDYPITIEVKN